MKAVLFVAALLAGLLALPSVASAAPTTYHVATSGADGNAGTSTKPFKTVQKAVDVAQPGDTILVHAGTYTGKVKITRSGTAAAPITLKTAGDGVVTLTASVGAVACNATTPTSDRTVTINSADYWTIQGFSIVNGVEVTAAGSGAAFNYFGDLVRAGNWQARRAIPGRGTNDPVAARTALDYVAGKTGTKIDPADGVKIIGNTITRRGIHVTASRYGTMSGNKISNIDCGTGGGIWVILFSDGWSIADNTVSNVAVSTYKHYMQEGIRLDSASNYNVVERNTVSDLPGDGRAFNTDVDPSWNIFRGNLAKNVSTGFNDQKSGWGNQWIGNNVVGFTTYGYSFRAMDGPLTQPSMDSSTNLAVVKCNKASGGSKDLWVGGIMNSTFQSNAFDWVGISNNAQKYWTAQGNTWNGSKLVPVLSPPIVTTGC